MRGSVKEKNSVARYFLFFGLSLVFLLFIPEANYSSPEWCRSLSLYLLVLFIFQLAMCRLVLRDSAKALPIIFLVVLYIFNFAQLILHGYGFDQFGEDYAKSYIVNDPMIVESTHIAITAIIGLFLGMTLIYLIRRRDFVLKKSITIKDYSIISLIIIYFIGFVADLITNIVVVIIYGYAGDNVEGIPMLSLIRLISLLLPSAVIISFVKPTFSARTKRIILIAFVVYKVICMMGGYRGFAMISILLTLFVYYKLCSPFKIKFYHVIIGLIVLQLGSGFMVGIRDSRHDGVDMETIITAMFDLKNSAIISSLSEFGYSINIINVVLSESGQNSHNGLLYSLMDVVPYISSITEVGNEASMDAVLGLRNIGGNLIADLLFGYGRDSLLLSSFVMGVIYAFFFEMFEKALVKRDPFILAFTFPLIVDLIFCARSSITKMPREIVWYFILVFVLTYIFPRKRITLQQGGQPF